VPETSEEIVEAYLRRMAEIRSTGAATSETSYYGALENLMNAVGRQLKPRVIANGEIRNQGAGQPDFGLYTQAQIRGGEPVGRRRETTGRRSHFEHRPALAGAPVFFYELRRLFFPSAYGIGVGLAFFAHRLRSGDNHEQDGIRVIKGRGARPCLPIDLCWVEQRFGILLENAGVLHFQFGSDATQDLDGKGLGPAVLHQTKSIQKRECFVLREPNFHAASRGLVAIKGIMRPPRILGAPVPPKESIRIQKTLQESSQFRSWLGRLRLPKAGNRLFNLVALESLHLKPSF
jgi:hypothetical protein